MSGRYVIEVSGAELEVISLAIGRMPGAKPVRVKATAATVTMPVFDTGDDHLDAWMREHWRPSDAIAAAKRRTAGAPRPVALKPRQWTKVDRWLLGRFNEGAVKAWRRLGHEVIIDGGAILGDGSNVRVLPLITK